MDVDLDTSHIFRRMRFDLRNCCCECLLARVFQTEEHKA